MIVQLTSSTMLPWVCTGLRSSPGRSRNRRATKIVIAEHADADHDRDPEERGHQVHDLVRGRTGRDAARSGRCWDRCRRSSRARRQRSPMPTVVTAPRRSRCMRSNIYLPSRRPDREGEPDPRRLYNGGFAGSQLCDSKSGGEFTRPMFRARGGRATTARRCQSRSTRTWVSRCTRTPRSASSSRRASVPAVRGASRRPGRSRCPAGSRARRV